MLLGSVQKGNEVYLCGAGLVLTVVSVAATAVFVGHAQSVCGLSYLQMTFETKRLMAELDQKKDELAKANDV